MLAQTCAAGCGSAGKSRRAPHRHAGAAMVAIRAVGEGPAAAKARGGRARCRRAVSIRWLGVATCERAARSGQIAAGVRGRRIELQRREGKVVELGHASTSEAGRGDPRSVRRGAVYQRRNALGKRSPRDRPRAERRKVRRLLLAVDQRESRAFAALRPDERKRDLRGVGLVREHRLAEEHAPDRDTVQAADQPARRATPPPNAHSPARAAAHRRR